VEAAKGRQQESVSLAFAARVVEHGHLEQFWRAPGGRGKHLTKKTQQKAPRLVGEIYTGPLDNFTSDIVSQCQQPVISSSKLLCVRFRNRCLISGSLKMHARTIGRGQCDIS
jgi:hypothetical protein